MKKNKEDKEKEDKKIPLSQKSEREKFNKFISECEEFSAHLGLNKKISESFPKFILWLFFKLNAEEILDALLGLGSNDCGVDACFFCEDEKIIHIIQFKSTENYKQGDYCDAKREWFSLLDSFLDKAIKDNLSTTNTRIINIRKSIVELDGYSTQLHLFHMGDASIENQNSYKNVNYYSKKDILQKYVEYYEQDLDDSYAPYNIELEISPKSGKEINNYKNYIFFTPKARDGKIRKTVVFPIRGDQIIKMITQGTTILERNVRGYLGDKNTVNKGIINTALKTPEHFYFFNNGISITCDELSVSGIDKTNPLVKMNKPQIVNGAQTVNSLKSAYEQKVKEFKKNNKINSEEEALIYMENIHVICKVMESNKKLNTDFSKSVTEFSNKQNKIKDTDFYSNRTEQKKIKEELSKYNIIYNIKRGKSFEEKGDYSINMENLAENHVAQTIEPFGAKSSVIFTDDCLENEESLYVKTFGNNGSYNSTRTKNLAITFFIWNFLYKEFMSIKKIYQELSNNKNLDINKVEYKKFFQITKSKKYFLDLNSKKEQPHIDNVSKNILIMDFKVLSYIVREIVESHNIKNQDDQDYKISSVFEKNMREKNFSQIELIINKVLTESLTIYALALNEILKNNNANITKHPKTKKSKEILNDKISEYISQGESIICDFKFIE